MNDQPHAPELLDAVRQFLEQHLLPTVTDHRLRFQTLIAAHVLGIVSRELVTEEATLAAEQTWLTDLLGAPQGEAASLAEQRDLVRGLNERLCQRIRHGDFDDPTRWQEATEIVRRMVVLKLEVANPRYLEATR
ncbi:MAG: DUF6285 domain-containing protein [Gemmataceae bacterium]